jgi:hypothetical protein
MKVIHGAPRTTALCMLGVVVVTSCGAAPQPPGAPAVVMPPAPRRSPPPTTRRQARERVAYVAAADQVCISSLDDGYSPHCLRTTTTRPTHVAFLDADTLIIAHARGYVSKLDIPSQVFTALEVWKPPNGSPIPWTSHSSHEHVIERRPDGLWARPCTRDVTGHRSCESTDACAPILGAVTASGGTACDGFDAYRWDAPRWDVKQPPGYAYHIRDAGIVDNERTEIVTCLDPTDRSVRDLTRLTYGLHNELRLHSTIELGLPGEPAASIIVFAFAVMIDDELAATVNTFGYIVHRCDRAESIFDIETAYPERLLRRGPGSYWAHAVEDAWVLRRGAAEVRRLDGGEPAFWPYLR